MGTRGPVRSWRKATHKISVGNRGKNQIRRFVLRPETNRGGGAFDSLASLLIASATTATLSANAPAEVPLAAPVTALPLGELGIFGVSNRQQEPAAHISAPSPPIIMRQQEWPGAGARHANAGAAAQRAATTSITIAPFLPIVTAFAELLTVNIFARQSRFRDLNHTALVGPEPERRLLNFRSYGLYPCRETIRF